MENVPNGTFSKVTKESCFYGYPVTRENKMANEYFWECHALCFSENRKGISQTYPKIEDFVQFNCSIF